MLSPRPERVLRSLTHYLRFIFNRRDVSVHLHHPGTVGESHDLPFFPKEGRVGPLDHLKFVELLHGVDLLGSLVTDLKGKPSAYMSTSLRKQQQQQQRGSLKVTEGD